jgi:ADP-dependent phosphofructokinase/glucokinase
MANDVMVREFKNIDLKFSSFDIYFVQLDKIFNNLHSKQFFASKRLSYKEIKELIEIKGSKKLPDYILDYEDLSTVIKTSCFIITRYPEKFIYPLLKKDFKDFKFKSLYLYMINKKDDDIKRGSLSLLIIIMEN